jgi:hypothetical protein
MFIFLSFLVELSFLLRYSKAFTRTNYHISNNGLIDYSRLKARSLHKLGVSSPPSFPFGDPFSPRKKTDYINNRPTSQQGKSSEVLIEAPSMNSRKISANIVIDAAIEDLW